MKVRIITFIRAYNYGAVLQCYALSKALNELGCTCDVLDYNPDIFHYTYTMDAKGTLRHPRLRVKIKRLQVCNILRKRNRNFNNFIKKYIPITLKQYKKPVQIKEKEFDVDCYITGSDQVWSNVWNDFDPIFFLDFKDASLKKKYSYAASFGFEEFPKNLREEYKRRLEGYEHYSVREVSASNLVKKLIDKDAEVHCDPTLLLTTGDWNKIIGKRIVTEPYILLYYTSRSELLHKTAINLQNKTGYKIVTLPCTMDIDVLKGKYDNLQNCTVMASAGPDIFLNLFKNAEYVLTNTFHGTVFSLIFHKKFLTQRISDSGVFNIRVNDLFNVLDVENRWMENDLDSIDIEQNWTKIEERINELRKKSFSYLYDIIE